MKKIIVLALLSFPLWCSPFTYGEPEFVQNKSTIAETKYNVKDDNYFLSIAGGTLISTTKLASIIDYDISILKRFNDYFAGVLVSSSTGDFLRYTLNHSTASVNPNAEVNYLRSEENKLTNQLFALSFAYRFNADYSIFGSSKWFEIIYVSMGLMKSSDDLRNLDYAGPGLKTNYRILRRITQHISLGVDFSLQIASVKREAIGETEPSSERSFSLQWATLGASLQVTF